METSLSSYTQARRNALRSRMADEGLDAFVAGNVHNVTYLTGFTGDSSLLVLTQNDAILLSDSRYTVQISEECPELETRIRNARTTSLDTLADVLKELAPNSIGLEGESVTKSQYDEWTARIEGNWVATGGWVESLRRIKDPWELDCIRKSIHVNQRAFLAVMAALRPDHSERQVAHDLEHQMRAFGASHAAFDPIVGVGERGALPHARLTGKRISEADFVLVDWGARVDGYASDLTRVRVTSKKIPEKFREIYETVLAAQQAAIACVRPGVDGREVDQAAREVIETAGYGDYFGHGLGHGFGLQIHERPFLSPNRSEILEPNMVITIEPGIYLPGWGGVRIEDDVLVTGEGCELLSDLPRSLDSCPLTID